LRAALEISRRYLRAELERAAPITDAAAAAAENYIAGELKALRREVFGCLFLDTRHRVIDFEILFYGTIDGASVHPREVVKRCLALNAAAAILAHNHPSGDPHPSDADRRLTRRLVKALELVDIRVLDHLVVGRDGCFSFARHGLL
jgi:DNA repair protein RadC